MTLTDLQTAIEGLNPYQIDQVTAQVTKYMKLNDELKQTRPEACPICGKTDGQLIKKGFQAGKQRYQCKDCGSKFTYDTKQLTAHSHQPVDSWITMIEDDRFPKAVFLCVTEGENQRDAPEEQNRSGVKKRPEIFGGDKNHIHRETAKQLFQGR